MSEKYFRSPEGTKQEKELYEWVNSFTKARTGRSHNVVPAWADACRPHITKAQRKFFEDRLPRDDWSVGYWACCALRGGVPEEVIRCMAMLILG